MSRILKKYEKEGLLVRQVKPHDARSYGLYLTEKGKKHAEKLIDLSNHDIESLIAHLNRSFSYHLSFIRREKMRIVSYNKKYKEDNICLN